MGGRSNRKLCQLSIEERTVKAHIAKLMRKNGVHNRLSQYMRLGIPGFFLIKPKLKV